MSAWHPANLDSFPRSASAGGLRDAGNRLNRDAGNRLNSPTRSDASRCSRPNSVASRASRSSRGLRASRSLSGPPGLQHRKADRRGPPSVQSGASSRTASGRSFPPRGNLHIPTDYFPDVGNYTITALPGYTGYIPAKQAENVIGATYHRANELACVAAESRSNPPWIGGRRINPWGLGDRGGALIPGYTGYIPGKAADNVFGYTYAKENELSQLIKHQQARDKQQRVNSYREGRRPPTGHLDYSGYRDYGAGGGLDSTG